jgi:hypothetical protein
MVVNGDRTDVALVSLVAHAPGVHLGFLCAEELF